MARVDFGKECKWVRAKFHPVQGGWFSDHYISVEATCTEYPGEPLDFGALRGDYVYEDVLIWRDIPSYLARELPLIFESGVNPIEHIERIIAKIKDWNTWSMR